MKKFVSEVEVFRTHPESDLAQRVIADWIPLDCLHTGCRQAPQCRECLKCAAHCRCGGAAARPKRRKAR